jgi:uncharacterized protein (TIGR02001 family)
MRLKFGFFLVVVLSFFPLSIYAQFSGSAKLTTDYIWYGVSQTQGKGAAQVTLNYDILDSGFYVNVFGSNVNFGPDDPAKLELDYAVGYSNDINDDWNIDLGITEYTYQEQHDYDYKNFYSTLKYKIMRLEFNFSDDEFASGTSGYYVALGTKFEIFKTAKSDFLKQWFFDSHIGYFKKDINVDGGSYTDYAASLIKELGKTGVNIELGWTDTSGRKLHDGQDTSRIFLAITKEF